MTSKLWVVVTTDARRDVCERSSCVLRDRRQPARRERFSSREASSTLGIG
jgi:hypothetical protein